MTGVQTCALPIWQLDKLFEEGDGEAALKLLHEILDENYISIETHFGLAAVYEYMGDGPRSLFHEEVGMRLLDSILTSGDGKSRKTAWKVIHATEEYEVLRLLKAIPRKQSIKKGNPPCDVLKVTIDGKRHTLYFDISLVFELYMRE